MENVGYVLIFWYWWNILQLPVDWSVGLCSRAGHAAVPCSDAFIQHGHKADPQNKSDIYWRLKHSHENLDARVYHSLSFSLWNIFFFLKLSLPEGKGLWTIYDHLWGSPLVFSVLGRKETGRMTLYETWLEFTHIPEKRLKMFHSFSDSFERMIIRMIRSGVVSNSGWWWLEHEFHDFPYLGNVIIPTDFHSIIFQRGRLKPPSRSIINHH